MTYLVAGAELPRPGPSYAFVPLPDGRLRVDAAMPCGHRFEGIAFIHDPGSPCPNMEVPRPLGFRALIEIMDAWVNAGRPHSGPPMPADEIGRALEPEQAPEDDLTL